MHGSLWKRGVQSRMSLEPASHLLVPELDDLCLDQRVAAKGTCEVPLRNLIAKQIARL